MRWWLSIWLPLLAVADVPFLTDDALWQDPGTVPVYTVDFGPESPVRPPWAAVYTEENRRPTVNRRLPGGGRDGGDCWVLEMDIPGGKLAKIVLSLPPTPAGGIHYRFLMKVETTPEFGVADLSMAANMGPHPVAHSVHRVTPLDVAVPKTGAWMTAVWGIWKAHQDVVLPGWMMVGADTSTYALRQPPQEMFDKLDLTLWNRTTTDRHVKLFLDDVQVVRRDVATAPEMRAVLTAPRPVIEYSRAQILRARDCPAAARPRWIAQRLAAADTWLTADIAVPRLQAGYPTKYYCDACKAFLRPDPPTGYVCTKCGKPFTGELYDKLLAYDRHQALGKATRDLGFAWQWTDDARYAARAEEILLAYADAIPHFQLGHNWLGTCWLVQDFLLGYDYVYEVLSATSRQRVDRDFLGNIRRIYHYNHFYPEGYAKLWETCGWIAVLTNDVDWCNYLLFSDVGNREVLLSYGLTADMISLKGPAYHGDVVRALNRMGNTLENCGVGFFDARVKPVYDAIFAQLFPDLSLPGFGHSNVGYTARIYGLAVPYRHYGDPRYLSLCTAADNQDNACFLGLELPAEPPPLRQPSTNLEALGLTMLRTPGDNATVLGLSWGAPKRNDPARLDFQLYGTGGHLLWSSGTTYYGNPLFSTWYQRSLSRNVPVVDAGSQAAVGARLLALDTAGNPQVVATELVDAYPDTRLVRVALLWAGGAVVLVDRCTSPRPRTVDWVCQLPGTVTGAEALTPVDTPLGDANGYDLLSDIRGGEPRPLLLRPAGTPARGVRIVPAAVPGTVLYLGQGFTGQLFKPSPLALLRRVEVTETTFATLFQPFGETPPDGEIAVTPAGVTVRLPEGRWEIVVEPEITVTRQ